MRRRVQLFLLCILPLSAADPKWLKVKSPNFELFTTAGERKGRDTIQHFEKVRGFFQQAMSIKGSPLPVRIIQFGSEKEYQPFQISAAAAAYYLGGHDTDYIVLGPAGQYQAVVHEYVHLLVRHSGLELPTWYNEGLADFYSTLTPVGNKIRVGEFLPGRVVELMENKWIPMDALWQAGHDSPYYNEKNRAGLFYSQSWALTHMLTLGDGYRERNTEFTKRIASGMSTEKAIAEVWSKSPQDIQKAVESYVRQRLIKVAMYDLELEGLAEKPAADPATPFEVSLELAILAMHTNRRQTAEIELERLMQENPERFEPVEALGYLRWRNNDNEKARQYFAKAFDLGAKSPKLLWDYARFEMNGRGDPARTTKILERVLEAEPGNLEARLALGQEYIRWDRHGVALVTLRQIRRVKPEMAYRLFYSLAYSGSKNKLWDEAARDAERAIAQAKDAVERERAQNLLAYIKTRGEPQMVAVPQEAPVVQRRSATVVQEAPPPDSEDARPKVLRRRDEDPNELTVVAEGKFAHLECLDKFARARVTLASGRSVQLLFRDPEKIKITGAGSGTIDLSCGPQPGKKVKVRYAPMPDVKLGTAGEVREIAFE
ncbi:MAG: hypothetical protein U0Q16_04335 [Bryobacteraceae bacterium]